MHPFDLEFAILDFETTGLSARAAEVVEVGAVRFARGRAGETFHALCRPVRPIPAAATSVHGIRDEMVATQPTFAEVAGALRAFLGDRVLVAHHARFDVGFLERAFRRAGWPPPSADAWCTVRLSRRLFPGLPRHDLDSLCVTHAIPRGAAHRALDDALATAALFGVLLERAAEVGAGTEELAAMARPPRAAPARTRPWTNEERAAVETAILTGDRLELAYVSRRGVRATRVVVPYVVAGPEAAPRLVAYDLAVGRTRTFRLDRVVSLRLLG